VTDEDPVVRHRVLVSFSARFDGVGGGMLDIGGPVLYVVPQFICTMSPTARRIAVDGG
jgi:hypothetical protein